MVSWLKIGGEVINCITKLFFYYKSAKKNLKLSDKFQIFQFCSSEPKYGYIFKLGAKNEEKKDTLFFPTFITSLPILSQETIPAIPFQDFYTCKILQHLKKKWYLSNIFPVAQLVVL